MLCWMVNIYWQYCTYQPTLSKCLGDFNFQQYGCENFLSGVPFLIICILFPLLLIFTFIITDLICDKLSVSNQSSKRTHPVMVVFSYFREANMGYIVQSCSPFRQTQTTLVSLFKELEESGKMKCAYRYAKHNFSSCETNSLYGSLSAAVSVFF